ncbi:hypothetical protein Cni_G19650 [Canna indica]|uniref:Uncharacterized protein n=1 Tax=Canna indica TaxID=4628 RepID=A0AAQ3QIQ7_9LILI|nr:hypothetical protein Cni_G19650 [Canna indica]
MASSYRPSSAYPEMREFQLLRGSDDHLIPLRHFVEYVVGFVHLDASGVEGNELGGEAGAATEEGGGNEAVEVLAVAKGADLGACLEEGQEEGGWVEGDAASEGGLEINEDEEVGCAEMSAEMAEISEEMARNWKRMRAGMS